MNEVNSANPILRIFNSTHSPQKYTYLRQRTYLPTNCITIDTFNIIALPKFVLLNKSDTAVCSGTTILLPVTFSGIDSWNMLEPISAPDMLIDNKLTLFNSAKEPRQVRYIVRPADQICTQPVINTVTVYTINIDNESNISCKDIFIPNIITPNNDNTNETFNIRWLELFDSNKLMIYNRWGKKVYEKTNYANPWAGQELPSGIYFYYLELNLREKRKVIKGWVEILE